MLSKEEKEAIDEYALEIANELVTPPNSRFLDRNFSRVKETISSMKKLMYFLECLGKLDIRYALDHTQDVITFYFPKNRKYVEQWQQQR